MDTLQNHLSEHVILSTTLISFEENGIKWFGHFKQRCLKIQETVSISFAVAVLILHDFTVAPEDDHYRIHEN